MKAKVQKEQAIIASLASSFPQCAVLRAAPGLGRRILVGWWGKSRRQLNDPPAAGEFGYHAIFSES